jgi:hypothetical protein
MAVPGVENGCRLRAEKANPRRADRRLRSAAPREYRSSDAETQNASAKTRNDHRVPFWSRQVPSA